MITNNVYQPTDHSDWITMHLLKKSMKRDKEEGFTEQAKKTERKYKNFIRSFLPDDDEIETTSN